MASGEFKINQQRRVPITRNSLFYDREQLNFDLEIGREYIETDMGQRIILYRVDYVKTNQDQLYMEANNEEIVFLPPVEVPCVYEVQDAELRAYDKQKNLGSFQKLGKLTMSVYTATLVEMDVDINVGDYIGVQIDEQHCAYWQVENDGKNNYANTNLMFGTVPVVRNITCSPVDSLNV